MSEAEQMKVLADQIWYYFQPKVKDMLRTSVSYFRAQVVTNPGDGTLEVKRPSDTTTMTLPCTSAVSGAAVDDQVIVFVLGDLSNAVVVSDGKMTAL